MPSFISSQLQKIQDRLGFFRCYPAYVSLLAVLLAVTANRTFFGHVIDLYSWSNDSVFLVSVMLLLVTFLVFLFSLLNLVVPARPLAVFFVVVAAACAYFSDHFATVIDTEMMRNMVETDAEEASDLVSTALVLHMIGFAVLPAMLILWLPYRPKTWLHERWQAGTTGVVSLVLMVVTILPFSDQYASFFREHRSVRYWVNPVYPLYSAFKFGKSSLQFNEDRTLQSSASYARIAANGKKPELVILVVGETARADHFSLNGYGRETNPLLARQGNIISFNSIYSCGTATAVSVPCMFSFMNRENFDVDEARWRENVLDIMHRAGVNVLWLDNNSGSKKVADRVEFRSYRKRSVNPVCDTECRDVGMLSALPEYIENNDGDIMIVLHQMGSHGPAYYKRYPKEFEKFKPACNTAELQNCTDEEIVNAYDNTILYTDYFLSQTIDFLKQYENDFETTMIYVSDHGESLGENGMYLHGLPYLFAPDAQKRVPLIVWAGEHSNIDHHRSEEISDNMNSHDALAGTLLELFEVETDAISKPQDTWLVMRDN